MGKRSKSELANNEHSISKRTRSTNNKVEENNSVPINKPKKILFDEDGNPELKTDDVLPDVTKNNSVNIKNKRKGKKNSNSESRKGKEQLIQSEDEEPKEEDIDKFCDEIEEEDNEQYENWVKLIEAKLTENKKKSKYDCCFVL